MLRGFIFEISSSLPGHVVQSVVGAEGEVTLATRLGFLFKN